MYRILIKISFCLFFFSASQQCLSSHIVGGEMSYHFIDNPVSDQATIGVTLTLYRDPQGIPYDQFATFGIFSQDASGQWNSYDVIPNIQIGIISEIQGDLDPCRTRNLDDTRMEIASYTFETTLDIGNDNYMISYQKCCRNYTINNITGGGNIGSVYDVLITPEALRQKNSSPTFSGTPPIFICAGYEMSVDQSIKDPEGDQVIYSFCTPFTPVDNGGVCGNQNPDPYICLPPYSQVNYIQPFSADNPMGGDPRITLDSNTGFMTGTPEEVGSYVVAICIEEYRNGILLSKTRRDYEFNVVTCEDNLVASIVADEYFTDDKGNTVAYYETCNATNFNFINTSGDEIYIQNYTWQFFDEDNNLVIENAAANNRNLSVNFDSAGIYRGLMILNDAATCFDTAFMLVNIVPEIDIQTTCHYDTCVAGPVTFDNLTNEAELIDWEWNLGDGTLSDETQLTHTYNNTGNYLITLMATDTFGCSTAKTKNLDWSPYQLIAPDTIPLTDLICHNDSVFIYDQWVSLPGTYFNYIPSLFNGCDSVIQKIDVAFTQKPQTIIEDQLLCQGETITYNNIPISAAGIYLDTLLSYQGCDSVIGIKVIELQGASIFLEQELCEGEITDFGGETIEGPGLYIDSLFNVWGCDSIVALQVYEVEEKNTYLEDGFCSNSSYIYNNDIITEPGSYSYTFEALSGCDSIVYLDLIKYDVASLSRSEELCEGGFTTLGLDTLYDSGYYTYIGTTQEGCDSIVVLDLNVLEESEFEYLDTICLGETYPFGAINLSLPGIYYDTLTNQNGCDSIVILDLVVGQNLTRIDVDEELEEKYGSTLILEPEVSGGDLINSKWFEVDEFISNELVLNYVVTDDSWVYFESTNDLFCVAIDSVFIRSKLEIDLYFPNLITPNGDGLNDIFNIGASETVLTMKLNIYDRWGNHIYAGQETEDKSIETGWDGTYRGQQVEIGTYAYMVEVLFINQERKIFSGEVQVLK